MFPTRTTDLTLHSRDAHAKPARCRNVANLKGDPMTESIVNTSLESRNKSKRALLACGLWLRVSFIGASGLAAGLLFIFDGSLEPLSALVLAVGGGILAAFSWWRAWTILDHANAPATVTAAAPPSDSAHTMAGA
jgi:hypothetical protein